MAFVTHYGRWPYTILKLLVPLVSNYSDKPEEYLYRRILGLYIHLQHALLGNATDFYKDSIDWRDKKLTRLWGKHNRKCAKQYEKELSKREHDETAP